jgi:uncharacterized damage-inducible protein DinB
MKHVLSATAVLLLLASFSVLSQAQEMKGFRADLLGDIQYAQKEIMELENAMPEKTMTWRPEEGVRSVSEVYLHIAHSNYLFMKFAGVALPAGISVESEADASKFEKATTDKKEIAAQLTKSFDFLIASLKHLDDASLEHQVTFFGQKMTMRGLMIALATHMHEHLGQSIAYARTNHIVPPWTAAQMAAQKEKKN